MNVFSTNDINVCEELEISSEINGDEFSVSTPPPFYSGEGAAGPRRIRRWGTLNVGFGEEKNLLQPRNGTRCQ
jgi:hypothetical protein